MARRTGRRTDYEWNVVGGDILGMDLTIGATGTGSGSFAALTFAGAGTVMRMRGRVLANLDAGAVDERVIVACGLIIVNANAAAAVATMPHPVTDGKAMWIWHDFVEVSSGAEAAIINEGLFDRIPIESKAMRRFKPSEVLVFVAEVLDVTDQAGTIDIQYAYRVLLGS